MAKVQSGLTTISGTFFRIIFKKTVTMHWTGRPNHRAATTTINSLRFLLSPKPEWAWKAVEPYIRADDPARELRQFQIGTTHVVDVRNRALCRDLGIVPSDSDVPWLPQLAAGHRPSTWKVSDIARQAEADGLIYTSRVTPERWYLVLFRWNDLGGPTVDIM